MNKKYVRNMKLRIPVHRSRILVDRRDGRLEYHHEGKLQGKKKVVIKPIGEVNSKSNKIHTDRRRPRVRRRESGRYSGDYCRRCHGNLRTWRGLKEEYTITLSMAILN